jgi:acetyltransferase-like isoleucine patch superfamily enzyme
MRLVWRLVPVALIELVARLAGYAVGVIRPNGSYKAERIVRGWYWAHRLSGRDLWIGRNVQFEGDRIKLGSRVRLYDGGHYVTGGRGWITIGDDTHISRMSVVSGLGGVTIGNGCAISAHVAIYSVTADTAADEVAVADRLKNPVVIGDNVYMGVGVKVIPGVHIGNDAVVAAGAVVTRDVPPGMLAKGVPATHAPLSKRASSATSPATPAKEGHDA